MYGILKDDAAPAEQAQPRFKVGQRVRVVKDGEEDGGSCHGAVMGSIGKVTEFDGKYYGRDDNWYFRAHELAPAFLPGDKVRVTKHSGYFAAGDIGEVESQSADVVYLKHGSYQRLGLPIDADSLELVAAQGASNGGQLRDPKDAPSAFTVIANQFSIGLDTSDYATGISFAQPSPCIVARVVSGTPRPSNIPYVHGSVQAATAEAERLARNNPGKEFAVYQRVAGRVAEVSYSMKEVA